MLDKLKELISIYKDIRLIKIFLFGFCSGFCLLLSGNTLNFWLASINIDAVTLGLFSLVTIPYISKYLWSPIIDLCHIPLLSNKIGRTKSWLLLSQILISIFTFSISLFTPENNLFLFSVLALFIAFFSVTQDMVLDTKRILLTQETLAGPASATYILGYRIGMLVSGAGAIFISYFMTWNNVYKILAIFILILAIIIQYVLPNEDTKKEKRKPTTILEKIKKAFIEPFNTLGSLKNILYISLFVFLYQSGDHMIATMRNLFVLQMGFNEIEIAKAAKLFGVIASVMGGFISGYIITKHKLKKCLFWFGLIHIISHFSFILQYLLGYNLPFLYCLVALEGITGGMVTASLIAYVSSLCNQKFCSSQYAFLSSLIGFSRMFFSSISGLILNLTNWPLFFIIIMLITIPSLFLVTRLNEIKK